MREIKIFILFLGFIGIMLSGSCAVNAPFCSNESVYIDDETSYAPFADRGVDDETAYAPYAPFADRGVAIRGEDEYFAELSPLVTSVKKCLTIEDATAVALSPTENILAIGSCIETEQKYCSLYSGHKYKFSRIERSYTIDFDYYFIDSENKIITDPARSFSCEHAIESLTFSPDGRFLAAIANGNVRLFSVGGKIEHKRTFSVLQYSACQIIMRSFKYFLITISKGGFVEIWDLNVLRDEEIPKGFKTVRVEPELIKSFQLKAQNVTARAISPDGRFLAEWSTGPDGLDGILILIDIEKGKRYYKRKFGTTGAVGRMVFNQFGNILAFLRPDVFQAVLVNFDTKKILLLNFENNFPSPCSLDLSASGQVLAVGGPGFVKVLNVNTHRIRKTFRLSEGEIAYTLAMSPDNTLVVAGLSKIN